MSKHIKIRSPENRSAFPFVVSDYSSPAMQKFVTRGGVIIPFTHSHTVRKVAAVGALFFFFAFSILPQALLAAPTIENIQGDGSLNQDVQGNITNITVAGNLMGTTTNADQLANEIWNIHFANPTDSLILNVFDASGTQLLGTINIHNGLFALLNSAGVEIAESAAINLFDAGFIASALGSINANLEEGKYIFRSEDGKNGFVLNEGRILGAQGSFVALVGRAVENAGEIEMSMGKVALAGGEAVTLSLTGQNDFISVVVDEAVTSPVLKNGVAVQNQIEVGGTIEAHQVKVDAKAANDLFDHTVNLTGHIKANIAVENQDGSIDIVANDGVSMNAQIEVGDFKIGEGTEVRAGTSDIHVEGDWINKGSFYGEESTVTFENAEKISHIYGDNTFYNFTAYGSDKTLLLEAGKLQTVAGFLDLKGEFAHLLKIHSTDPGIRFLMDVRGDYALDFVDITDSEQISGERLLITRSHSAGNISGWIADPVWTNNNGTGIWSDGLNWDSGVAPGAGNDVFFNDSASGSNSLVDAAFAGSINSLNIGYLSDNSASNYSGAITLGRSLTITTNGGGTWAGSFRQNSGIFSMGSNTMTLHRHFSKNGGTFDAGTGTIEMLGSVWSVFDVGATTQDFYNVTINGSGDVFIDSNEAGGVLQVNGLLTLANSALASGENSLGVLHARGDVVVGENFDGHYGNGDGGNYRATLLIDGDQEQSVSIAAGAFMPKTVIDNALATVSLSGTGEVTFEGRLILEDGVFNMGSTNLTSTTIYTGGSYEQSGGTFNLGTGVLSLSRHFQKSGGTFNADTGTVKFVGNVWGVFRVGASTQDFYNLEINKDSDVYLDDIEEGSIIRVNGTLTLANGALAAGVNSLGNLQAKGDVVIGSGFDGNYSNGTGGYIGTLLINGDGEQAVSIAAGATLPRMTINNADATVTFSGAGTVTAENTLTLQNGIINLGSTNLTVLAGGSGYVQSGGTFNSGTSTFTVNNGFNLSGGTFNAGSGILMMNSNNGFAQSGGTFNGDSSAVTITGSSYSYFTLSGGVFNATSGLMTLHGPYGVHTFTHTAGGTFNAGSGTVKFTGYGVSFDVNSTDTFNNLVIELVHNAILTIGTGDTLIAGGELTLTDGKVNTGTINALGTVNAASPFDGGDGLLLIDGDSPQTVNFNGGYLPRVTIDNDQATINYNALTSFSGLTLHDFSETFDLGVYGLTVNSNAGYTQTGGVVEGGSGTITITGNNSAYFTLSGGTFNSTSGILDLIGPYSVLYFTHTAGGTFNAGTGTVRTGSYGVTFDVAGNETFNNLIVQNYHNSNINITSGDTLIVNGALTLADGRAYGGTLEARGDVEVGTGWDGGDATYLFNGTGTQTISASSAGAVYFGTGQFNMAGSGTVSLDPSITDLTIGFFSQSNGTFNGNSTNINVNGNGGGAGFTLSGGTFNAPSATLTLHGPYGANYFTHTAGGTFNAGTGTVKVTGNGAVFDVNSTETFNHLTVETWGNSQAVITSGDTLIVNGTLTLNDGKIMTGTVNAKGDIVVGALWDQGNAAYTISGAGAQTISGTGSAFTTNTITVANTGVASLGTNTTVSNLVINAGGTLNLNGKNFTATGFTVNGTLQLTGDETLTTPTLNSGSTVEYIATSGTRDIKDWTYHHLSFDGAGGTFTLPADLTGAKVLGGNLTITAGTLNQGVRNIETGATGGITIGAAGTLFNNSTGDLTIGSGGVSNSGYIRLDGTANGLGDADAIQIRSTSDGVARAWAGTGVFRIYDVDVKDQNGSITAYSSTNTGNSNWTFSGGTPAEKIWVGGGGDSNWNTGANWLGGIAPSGTDIAVFDLSGGTNGVTFNSGAVNPLGVQILQGFGGVVTLGTAMTLGASGYSQSGGTFTAGANILDVNGTFTLEGGTFNAPSTTLRLSGNVNYTGGTFNHNSGTVMLDGTADRTLTWSGPDAMNNLVVNDGLVGYWKLNDGTGSTATDASGLGVIGTITGSTWVGGAEGINFTNSGALSFDGSDDKITMNTTLLSGTGDFTLSAWVMRSSEGTTDYIMGNYGLSNNNGIEFYVGTGNVLRAYIGGEFLTGVKVLNEDTWYHVTLTRSGGTGSFYVNGAQDVSGVFDNNISSALNWTIGNGPNYTTEAFGGMIDDARVYNRALSAQEIQALAIGNQPATAVATTTLGSDLNVDGNMVINAGELDAATFDMTIAGNWENNGGVFTSGTGTVTLDGTEADKYILSGGQSFNNLTIDGNGGEWMLQDKLDVDGALAIADGTLDVADSMRYGLSFDGVNDYLSYGGLFDVVPDTWSISYWLYIDSLPGSDNMRIMGTRQSGGDGGEDYVGVFQFDTTGQMSFFNMENGNNYNVANYDTLNTGTWYHVVGTWDGTQYQAYTNAVLKGTTAGAQIQDSTGTYDFEIGRRSWVSDSYADIKVDEFQVYDRALSQSDIATLYNGGTGYYGSVGTDIKVLSHFDEGAGTEILDRSGNNYTGVLNGASWTSSELSFNNHTVHAGSWNQTGGTFEARTGTVVLDGLSNSTFTPLSQFYNLRIEDPSEDGLVGYWKFDEANGTYAYDASGNGNNGTLTNTPFRSRTVNGTTVYDNSYSMSFDGTDDYVSIPESSSWDFTGSNDGTISFWINPTALSGSKAFLSIGDPDPLGNFIVYTPNSDATKIAIGKWGTGEAESAAGVLGNGAWHNVTVVKSGVNTKVYVDNTEVISTNTNYFTTGNIQIGMSGTSWTYNGQMDDVRVYDRALDIDEIANLAAGRYASGASSTATQTLGNDLTVQNLQLDSGKINTGAYDATVANLLHLQGGNGEFIAGSGTVTLNSGLTVAGGTFTGGSGTVDVNGDLLLSSGTLTAPSGTLALSGDWTQTGGTFTHNSGTVTFDGTGAQSIKAIDPFYNLTINKASGTATASSSVDMDGDLTISQGTLTVAATALDFDGTNDYISINDSPDLRVQNHTISFWVRPNSFGGHDVLVGKAYTNSGANSYAPFINQTGSVLWGHITTEDGSFNAEGTTPLTVGEWAHVTQTWDGSNVKIYLNGVLEASTPTTGTIQYDGSPVTLGADDNNGLNAGGMNYFFDGKIDDARIYNRALLDDEIADLANRNVPSTEGLVGHWKFDEGTSATVRDASGNDNTGMMANMDPATDWVTGNVGNTLNVAGDWANSGTFNAGTGLVTFDGANQSISGDTTFYNFVKSVTGADTLTFEAGSTQTISNALTLTGDSGNMLQLRSSSAGNQWSINTPTTYSISYVDAKDSNNTGVTISPSTSTNSGNNSGWNFVANTFTWDGSESAAWDYGGNWNLGYVPGVGDTVIVGNAPNAANLSSSVTVKNMTVASNGTLDLNGFNFTVSDGTGGFAVQSGATLRFQGGETFTNPTLNSASVVIYDGAGSYTIKDWAYGNLTIDGAGIFNFGASEVLAGSFVLASGTANLLTYNLTASNDFTQTGGVLNAGSGNLQIADAMTVSGGTFNAETGTVTFSGIHGSIDAGNASLNHVVINKTGGSTTTITGTLDVDGDLTISAANVLNGTITVAGDMTITDTGGFSGTLIQLDGVDDQTIATGGTTRTIGSLTIDKISGTISFSPTAALSLSGNFSLMDGTFETNDGMLDVNGSFTQSGGVFNAEGATLYVAGIMTVSGGTFNAGTGTVVLDAVHGGINIGSTILNDLVINKGGASNTTITGTLNVDGDLTITQAAVLNGTITVAGDFTLTDTGTSGTLIRLDGAGNQAINTSGVTGSIANLTIDKASGTVSMGASAALSISNDFNLVSGGFVTNNRSVDINRDFVMSGGSFTAGASTINVNRDLTISGGTFDAGASTFVFDGSFVAVNANGYSFNNVTINQGGAASFSAGTMDVNGLLTVSDIYNFWGTILAGGDVTWADSSQGTGLLTLDGTGNQAVNTNGVTGVITNLTVNKASGTATMGATATLSVTNAFNLTSGAFDLNGRNLSFGSSNISGTLKLKGDETITTPTLNSGSTVEYTATSGTRNLKNWAYHNLVINGAGGTFTLGNDLDIQNLTLSAGTFNDSGRTINVSGNWVNNGGAFTPTGTVIFDGSGTHTITSNSDNFNDVVFGGSGQWTLQDNMNVDGDFTINTGTMIDNGKRIYLAGNWAKNGGAFTATGEVILDGTAQSISGSTTFFDLTKEVVSADTLVFEAGETQNVAGTLTLQGGSGTALLNLCATADCSASPGGVQWKVFAVGSDVNFAQVRDSENLGAEIVPGFWVDVANNTGWDSGGGYKLWMGTVSNVWSVAANWLGGILPSSTDNVYIQNVANAPVLDQSVTTDRLTIGLGAVLDLNGHAITANDTFTNQGTLKLLGTEAVTITNATSAGTVEYVGSGNYTGLILGNSYYNVTFSGSGVYTLNADLTAVGELIVTGNLNAAGYQISEGGNWTVNQFANIDNLGDVLLTGTSKTIAADEIDDTFENLTVSGTYTLANSIKVADDLIVAGSGKALSLSGYNADVEGDVVFSGGGILNGNSGSVNVAGRWLRNVGTFDAGTSTVTFDGAGLQTVLNGNFYNLTNQTSGTLQFGSAPTVSGTLNQNTGVFDLNGYGISAGSATVNLNGGTVNPLTGSNSFGTLNLNNDMDLNASAASVSVTHLNLNGTSSFIAPGAGKSFNLSGNFARAAGASFNANGGTLTLTGGNQTISGDNTFYNLTKINGSEPTLTFAAGSTQTIQGALNLQGGAAHEMNLRSSSASLVDAERAWYLNPLGAVTVAYVDLKDSVNLRGTDIATVNSIDSGNNTGWLFPASTLFIWLGTLSTDWLNPGNWNVGGLLPGASDDVIIATAGNQPVLGGDIAVNDLTLNSGTSLTLGGHGLSVTGTFFNDGIVYLRGNEAISLTNGNDVNSGYWHYLGDGTAGTITIHDFGNGYDYAHLTLTSASGNTYDLGANLSVAGTWVITGGVAETLLYDEDLLDDYNVSTGATSLSSGVLNAGGGVHSLGSLSISGGADFVAADSDLTTSGISLSGAGSTFTAGALDVDVYGAVSIGAGTIFTAPSANLNITGNFSNSGTFSHNSGAVVLTGGTQSISGLTTFNDLTKNTPGGTLSFGDGLAQRTTVLGTLTLLGANGNLLTLQSATPGLQWQVDAQGGANVAFVRIQDGFAVTPLSASSSTDLSGNTAWSFGANLLTWLGGTEDFETDWFTAANWDLGYVPDDEDSVIIANTFHAPLLTGAITVNNLTIQSGASLGLNGQNLEVSGVLSNAGTIQLIGTEATITLTNGNDTNSGLWEYLGDGSGSDITIKDFGAGYDYYNLTLNSSSGSQNDFILNADLNVAGQLAMTGMSEFNASGRTVDAGSGNLTDGIYRSSVSTQTFGSLSVSGGGTLELNSGVMSVSSDIDLGSGATVNWVGGTVNVSGNLSIVDGVTLDASGAGTVTVSGSFSHTGGNFIAPTLLQVNGDWVTSAGFDANGGAVTFTGGGNHTVVSNGQVFHELNQTGGGTLQLSDALRVTSELSIGAGSTVDLNGQNLTMTGATFTNGGTLQLQGNETLTNFTLPGTLSDMGTWKYVGHAEDVMNVAANGQPAQFYTLIFEGDDPDAAFNLAADIAVANTLTITSGNMDANGRAVAVTGLATVSGGTYEAGSGTQTLNGGLTVSGGIFTGANGTVDVTHVSLTSGTLNAPTGDFLVSGNWTNSGATFNSGTGTVNFDSAAGTQTLNAGASTFNDLLHSGAATLQLTGSNLNVSGSLTNDSGTFDANGRAVTAAGLVTVSGGTYEADAGTQTLNGGLTVNGGAFTGGAGTVDVTHVNLSSGTLTAPAGDMLVSGNWAKTGGTLNIGAGTVTFDGAGVQTLNQGDTAFNHLTHDGLGTLRVTNNDLSVAGLFENAGGIFDANGRAVTVTGAATVSGGTYEAGAAKQTFNSELNLAGGDYEAGSGETEVNGTYAQTGGTFTGSTGDLDINGNFDFTGGTFVAPEDGNVLDDDFTVSGNFNVGDGVAFDANGGKVTLDSSDTAIVDAPDGELVFWDFSILADNKIVQFRAGDRFTVLSPNTWVAQGTDLTLTSTNPGTHWEINVADAVNGIDLEGFTVSWSNNVSGTDINCPTCFDGGDNLFWSFETLNPPVEVPPVIIIDPVCPGPDCPDGVDVTGEEEKKPTRMSDLIEVGIEEECTTDTDAALRNPACREKAKSKIMVHEGSVWLYCQDASGKEQICGTMEAGGKVEIEWLVPPSQLEAMTAEEREVSSRLYEEMRRKIPEAASVQPQIEISAVQPRFATLTKFQGEVLVKRAGTVDWVKAQPGMVLGEKDEIKTGRATKVEVHLDRDAETGKFYLYENSLLRLAALERNGVSQDKNTVLDLAMGRVITRAEKLEGESKFKIRTPTAVAGVRGTLFEIWVERSQFEPS